MIYKNNGRNTHFGEESAPEPVECVIPYEMKTLMETDFLAEADQPMELSEAVALKLEEEKAVETLTKNQWQNLIFAVAVVYVLGSIVGERK